MTTLHFLHDFYRALSDLPVHEKDKIYAHLTLLREGEVGALTIKTLRGGIQELIVHRYRLIFFKSGEAIYFVSLFKKQSQKTPLRIIRKAEAIYKTFKQLPWKN
ncbi:MAG: type II toxin-antitoxin system RelE/ParE family toxin [Minisyncoccia bacterium]|jgi:phage-related protein